MSQADRVPAPRRWLITGASGGLGRALVDHVLGRGDAVVATVRRPEAAEELRALRTERLRVELLDVTDRGQIDRVLSRVLADGALDVVVNNAGYAVAGASEEMTDAAIVDQIETLLLAPMRISRAVLPSMRAAGGGHLIEVSSLGGQVALPISSAYHAGKWGLEGFAEALSQEVAELGIRVTIAVPGSTRTHFHAGLRFTDETDTYRNTAVGRFRRMLENADESLYPADPARLAEAIYDVTLLDAPPLRLTLGADALRMIRTALTHRLVELDTQQDLAASMGFEGAASSTSLSRVAGSQTSP
jgi:NAD(P)-dependent dehydrogenase (short-subunit alcohol dehydrogenase family)